MKQTIKKLIHRTVKHKSMCKFFGKVESYNIAKDFSNKNRVYNDYYMEI